MPKRTKQRNSKSTLRRHQATTRFPTVTESKKGRFKTSLLRGGLRLLRGRGGGGLGRGLGLLGRRRALTLASGLGLGRGPEGLEFELAICTVGLEKQSVSRYLPGCHGGAA